MTLVVAVILGSGVGVGLLLVARAFTTRPRPLADIIATLDRPGLSLADLAKSNPRKHQGLDGWKRSLARVGVRAIEAMGFIDAGVLREQLRILDTSIERHAYEKMFGAVAGFLVPVAMFVVLAAGGVSVSPILALLVAVAGTILGFFSPDLPLGERVAKRQQAFRHALSSYLDLVTIILAGGGGIESALEGAADAGDGWAFGEIRGALRRAQLTRRTPWELFDELGDELGINELRELAASVALAGGHGAKVKQSLIAKADAMRAAQAAEIETNAEVQTEKMIAPVVVLVMGLVLFIGYGAVDRISTGGTDFEDDPAVIVDDVRSPAVVEPEPAGGADG